MSDLPSRIVRRGLAEWAAWLAVGAVICALATALGALTPPLAAKPAAPPATPAAMLAVPGLPNVGRVSDRLYRGAQPTEEGLVALKRLGVTVVVSLRQGEEQLARERRLVNELGMRFVSIPTSGIWAPSTATVARFLELVRASPGETVFVHCRRGAERTGVMVAAFRIAVQGWTSEAALAEMKAFGWRTFLAANYGRLVRRLPELLAGDAALRGLAAAPAPP